MHIKSLNLQTNINSLSKSSSSNSTSATSPAKNIWETKQKTSASEEQDKMLLHNKVTSEEIRLMDTYSTAKQYKEMENLEKGLRRSEFSIVATTSKLEIKDIADKKIPAILNSFESKCANCKSENEIQQIAKEIEYELMQQQHIVNTMTQRAYKAQALDNKLNSIKSDPKKAQLAEKIDTQKLFKN